MAASNDATSHAAHFVIFGAPGLVMAGLVAFQELRGRRRDKPDPSAATTGPAPPWKASWQWVAGGGTAAAALTHAFVIPEHFKESLLYGVFFVVLMAAQSVLGVMLVRRPSRKLFQRVGLGSLAVVGLWLISRTSGLPVGPHPWQPETFGRLDSLASLSELATVAACARLLGMRFHPVRAVHDLPARAESGVRARAFALGGAARRVLEWLPRGHPLPEPIWRRRHRGIVAFALAQGVAVGAFGFFRGYAVVLCVADVALVGFPAVLALSPHATRRLRTIAATTSLMLASVTIVDLAGGVTEAHFHFFVMVGVVALYQDWTAFGVCFLITVLDHAVMGTILPSDVYGSPAEQRDPIAWAFVHGGFILAVAFTHLLAWRNNEAQFLSDPLTRLPNRAAFTERLSRAMADLRQPVSVLFVDLDNFKNINDSYGHAVGDRALQTAADRMEACVRQTDVLARLGGDEFAIIVQGPEALGPALAARISSTLQTPLIVDGAELFVHACIGVANTVQARSRLGDDLLRGADLAMYLAKSSGKNGIVVYDAKVDQAVRDRADLAASLPRALQDEQFRVEYQPVVTGGEGALVGIEALLRWDHPTLGEIGPATFVPIAEEIGQINAVGLWVLQTAAIQMVEWNALRPLAPDLTIAVNISPLQLGQRDFVASVRSVLEITGLRPSLLILEVTEGLRLYDWTASCTHLSELRSMGVRIAIDDFGTGYSSLSYLAGLPADIVKIDQSFVRDLHARTGSVFLIKAILEAARSLDLEVIAEGVETLEQQTVLSKMGCLYSQGYLHSKALRPEGVTAILARLTDDNNHPAPTQQVVSGARRG